MQKYLIDILACPVCEAFPLQLINLSEDPHEIESGVLRCNKCHRWFPILRGIPHLIRDGLRLQEEDLAFLRKNRDRLPEDLTQEAPPMNLCGRKIERTEADQEILSEGAYWSEFTRAHYSVGDTSFLDIRSKSTHPSFYPLGVLEPDERDKTRLYGMWPNHLGRRIFGFIENLTPGWSLDVGCGGGQFGLETAWRGWKAVGIDIAPGALEVGRDYALKKGLSPQYIYAEPSNPPFRKDVFDLLLIKDTLHHLHDVDTALKRLDILLKTDGRLLIFDHVGYSPAFRWIMEQANRRLHPKIKRRYHLTEVPEILSRESPSEDVGRKDVIPLAQKYFHVEKIIREMMLYYHLEIPVYYAFGKRPWFSRLVSWMTRWLIEKPLLLFQEPEYAVILGGKKKKRD